jgi:phospholipase/carboxylesterase
MRRTDVYYHVAFSRILLEFVVFVILFQLLSPAATAVSGERQSWKYDLHPGDHLIYQYELERTYRGEDAESHTKSRFVSHVLVAGVQQDRISVGFERTRESAELLSYKENGRDKLKDELPKFQARLAKRPIHFSEAVEFTKSGEPQTYWEVGRESPSKLLFGIHEIEGLPPTIPEIGGSWDSVNVLGLRFRYAGLETLRGHDCARIEGTDSGSSTHLRYWWCGGSGILEKIEFEATYSVPGGTIHEAANFELTGKRRDEDTQAWLQDEQLRDGFLRAIILSPWVATKDHALGSALQTSDQHTQILALTHLLQNKSHTYDPAMIQPLLESSDPIVKELSQRLVQPNNAAPERATAECKITPQKFPQQQFGTTLRLTNSGHPYMMRVPGTYQPNQKTPLLIYLSGGGGLAIDGVNTAEESVSKTDYLVLYPHAGDYWWKPDIRSRVDSVIKEVLQQFNVDTDRIYIAGFSNGGTGALDYAELWPQRFAAVVSLMGAGQCNEDIAVGLRNLQNLPMLFVHGDHDERIPASCSRDTVESLNRAAMRHAPVLRILEKREHDVTLNTDDELTLPFFENKSRTAYPTKFTARWQDLSFPRRYWVELLEKGTGTAELSAEIKQNRIDITTRSVKRLRLLLRREQLPAQGSSVVFVNRKKVFEGTLNSDCRTLQESASSLNDFGLAFDQAIILDVPK